MAVASYRPQARHGEIRVIHCESNSSPSVGACRVIRERNDATGHELTQYGKQASAKVGSEL